MNKDFEWLKWVGLFTVISILGAVVYQVQNDKKKGIQVSQEIQIQQEDKQYEEKLEQAAIAIHEGQIEAEHNEKNPPVYESLSIEQTKKYIEQVEQLRAEDIKVNLNYLPDVAAQSRKYNALVDQAIAIYGENDLANYYRYCTNVAWMARELWTSTYSPSSAPKEFNDNSKKLFLEAYTDAKKGCLEEVANPSS